MTTAAPTDPALPRVSCIVPAYNEAARIGRVLTVLSAHPLIDEVIVIDDGSADGTAAVAESYAGVTTLALSSNGGKSAALCAGLACAKGNFILLIDADLEGLDETALSALILPVLEGRADLSMSLRRNAPRLWHLIGIDYITGERCLRRSILSERMAEIAALPRFGFEVWLNSVCLAARTRIAIVPWDEVDSPSKARKRGMFEGIAADIRMMSDLFAFATPARLGRQILGMRKLRV